MTREEIQSEIRKMFSFLSPEDKEKCLEEIKRMLILNAHRKEYFPDVIE